MYAPNLTHFSSATAWNNLPVATLPQLIGSKHERRSLSSTAQQRFTS